MARLTSARRLRKEVLEEWDLSPVEGRILPGAVCALLGRTGGVVGSETGGGAEASPGREGAPPPSLQPHAAGNPA